MGKSSVMNEKVGSELRQALGRTRRALWTVVAVSAMINVLAIASSIYLLLIYDSVLPSQSLPTLLSLLAIFALAFLFHGIFEILRGQMLSGIANSFSRHLSPRVLALQLDMAGQGASMEQSDQPVRDLDTLRGFIAGRGLPALIDMPWVVLFLGILTMLDPWLGLTALVGVIVLGAIAWFAERKTYSRITQLHELGQGRRSRLSRNVRHAGVIRALGMAPSARRDALLENERLLEAQSALADSQSAFGGVSRTFRIFLQSLVMSVGAWLVISEGASAGIIFASSILAGRALAPVDAAIANWRGFAQARQSWARLDQVLVEYEPAKEPAVELPAPSQSLEAQRLVVVPPGEQRIAVADASFVVKAGEVIGVVGPSGSGKSSLMRALVGQWPAVRGSVRIDGAELSQWDSDKLGRSIGYLPQDIAIFGDSVGSAIARGDPNASSDSIVAAAKAAGVHDLITGLTDGYAHPLGEAGERLSGGQRQRIALARALYGDPFLLVLDEPNSNLDPEGKRALAAALAGARSRGALALVVTHQPELLDIADKLIVLQGGKITHFGERSEVMKQIGGSRARKDSKPSETSSAPEEKSTRSQSDGFIHARKGSS